MATNAYVGENASYRAAKTKQIHARQRAGATLQGRIEGVEEFAIECSILKVAVSKICGICR
jgi:hypothetical protein